MSQSWTYSWACLNHQMEEYVIFLPHSHLTPSLGVNPVEFLNEFFIPKTGVLGLSVGDNFVILVCIVFTQCQLVTHRQTDRHPDDG